MKGETTETDEGKMYGKTRTRPLFRPVTPRNGEGSSAQGARQAGSHSSGQHSLRQTVPTLAEFVATVMADETTLLSDRFETVCHQYSMIDEQIESERKRRRNEVNIAAGAIDPAVVHRLVAKYTGLVEKILAVSGIVATDGAVVQPGEPGPVGRETTCSPVNGFSVPGASTEEAADGGSIPAQSGGSAGGIHASGGINTIAGAAEILRTMASANAKGKDPVIEDDYQGNYVLPVRRSTPVGRGRGLVIDEPISVSSGRASGLMPVWDISGGFSGGINDISAAGIPFVPVELELDMMYGSDEVEKEFQYSPHPSILGLSHASYPSSRVDNFYDSFSYLVDEDDLAKRYYVSMDKAQFGWTIILTGKDVKTQMEDETEISYHTMAASNRDTNLRDRSMYRDVEHPWGALVEPDWAVNYHAFRLNGNPDFTGVSRFGRAVKSCWSLQFTVYLIFF